AQHVRRCRPRQRPGVDSPARAAAGFVVTLHHRGAYAIQPAAAIGSAGCGERGTAELLCIQTVVDPLWTEAPDGQRICDRLGFMLVAKTVEVAEFGGIRVRCHWGITLQCGPDRRSPAPVAEFPGRQPDSPGAESAGH